MNFSDRHVVVTGGTGALGTAVVGALLEAGATCHVPWFAEKEVGQFPHRGHKQVVLVGNSNLSDEESVARLFGDVEKLWGSIHLVGGFAMSPVAKTSKAELMQQIEMNLVTCFLCCRAAVNRMAGNKEGRIVNVAARPALEWRSGAGMAAYTASKAGVAALTAALAEEVAQTILFLASPDNRVTRGGIVPVFGKS